MHRQTGRATPTLASTWTQHTKKGKFWTKRPERANFGLSDQNRKNLEIVLQQKLSCNRGLYNYRSYHKRQISQPVLLKKKTTEEMFLCSIK